MTPAELSLYGFYSVWLAITDLTVLRRSMSASPSPAKMGVPASI